jgi:hypothetical protein
METPSRLLSRPYFLRTGWDYSRVTILGIWFWFWRIDNKQSFRLGFEGLDLLMVKLRGLLRGLLVVAVPRSLIFRLVDAVAKHPFAHPYPLPTDPIVAELGTNVLIPAKVYRPMRVWPLSN